MDEERLSQREVLEKFARAVVERRMAAPAIFLFESIQPLAFVAGQALAFVEPMLRLVLDSPDYTVFREAIEDRDNVRWLVERLEELERGDE